MEGPLVSCIVPVFNGSAYLREAFDSIFGQRYRPLDVVAVDDGSTERTEEILADYGPAVRIVRQANAGPAAARNRGVAVARGDFIAFLDQDDLWHPDKLVRQMTHLAQSRHIDVSVAYAKSFWPHAPDAPGASQSRSEAPGGSRRPDQPRAGAVPGYVTGTMLARRAVFDKVGGFQTAYRYVDSLDWFARATECGVVVELLQDVLLYHRVHERNLSRQGGESRAECVRIIRSALARRRALAVPSP